MQNTTIFAITTLVFRLEVQAVDLEKKEKTFLSLKLKVGLIGVLRLFVQIEPVSLVGV